MAVQPAALWSLFNEMNLKELRQLYIEIRALLLLGVSFEEAFLPLKFQ